MHRLPWGPKRPTTPTPTWWGQRQSARRAAEVVGSEVVGDIDGCTVAPGTEPTPTLSVALCPGNLGDELPPVEDALFPWTAVAHLRQVTQSVEANPAA